MKTVLFSDTHLSHQLDASKFQLLKKIIYSADRIIINGDFWDSYLTTFDCFLHSGWNDLFPLLKQRQTVYIIGNHDPLYAIDHRWQLFANTLTEKYVLAVGNKKLHIEHGHGHHRTFDLQYPNTAWLLSRWYSYLNKLEEGGHLLSPVYQFIAQKSLNDTELLTFAKKQRTQQDWYIFGHSHLKKYSESIHYVNPGQFRCGVGNWLHIDQLGRIKLFSKKY